ncbi:trans-2-decenoyl-ACP isomerase [Streptococcus himalayensis]|uniref:Enoyl-CoA hydratase n=1 Tax=Streptococcus himalayensis TaxID=1888195 RepID=A0A917EEV1_9STRE|nr:enoyl-CoA hydratase [Streptococcus himalayensis]GGE25952.1 enoyl-CoA hydratase [Streptococcus himalayensis]
MDFTTILYEVLDDVGTIILNRPEVSNGFNVTMCREILAALDQIQKDDRIRFCLMKANGKVFSVGGDLAEMYRAVEEDEIESLVAIAELVNDISYTMKRLSKPVIMLVDGAVAGAAANLAVAADFCLATEKSRFIQAFVGVALAPDAGGLFLLSRSIGVTRAVQLAMTGESLSAQKAYDCGLLYKVSEKECLEKDLNQLLKKLRRGSANSYRAIKELSWKSHFTAWKEYRELELMVQKTLAFTEDFKEGVRAYQEKRRPKFIGK